MREAKTITELEKTYLTRPKTYIACEDMDFGWSEQEVLDFDEMWQDGCSLEFIAKRFDRDIDEVALLLIDRARKRKCKPRKHGIY
ncbi:hypothetical protein WD019_15370 [Fictibacillus sp. Mic-4]|uniref:hypothetical protein n=1 Tax=Fictibacillus sp. Mic-4 TaxID=3132826 RepID=UPI003CED0964